MVNEDATTTGQYSDKAGMDGEWGCIGEGELGGNKAGDVRIMAERGMMESTIKIGPIKYKVVETEGLNLDGKPLDGHIVYNECEIRVKAEMNEQAKRQTTWHEIIHGILTHAGITGEKEATVDVIAFGVMAVLQDNPWLRE